jgi:hypothetical protein
MIPSTVLQAKVGNAKWLACLVGAGGVTGLLMATVRGADGLIFVRFLVGICMAGITPGMPAREGGEREGGAREGGRERNGSMVGDLGTRDRGRRDLYEARTHYFLLRV